MLGEEYRYEILIMLLSLSPFTLLDQNVLKALLFP